jgi:hypothetical protein
VVVAIRGTKQSYDDLKTQRLARLTDRCLFAGHAPFGTAAFPVLIRNKGAPSISLPSCGQGEGF